MSNPRIEELPDEENVTKPTVEEEGSDSDDGSDLEVSHTGRWQFSARATSRRSCSISKVPGPLSPFFTSIPTIKAFTNFQNDRLAKAKDFPEELKSYAQTREALRY